MRLNTLVYQGAVIAVQRHHIGHRTQRHQVEILCQDWVRAAACLQTSRLHAAVPQGQHDVKGHTDTGEILAGKGITRQVRIDDGIGRRQLFTRQVVVGDQHAHTALPGRRDTVETGDAVIHGHDQVRLLPCGNGHDLGGQAIAVFKTVGHQVAHIRGPKARRARNDSAQLVAPSASKSPTTRMRCRSIIACCSSATALSMPPSCDGGSRLSSE